MEERLANGQGPVTPEGDMGKEKYRLVVEGPPNYTNFRQFWKMFYDEGAVVVASSYTKVGGVYDFGFRHDPDNPLETLAEYCLGVYTNRSLPMRIDMLTNYVKDYEADFLSARGDVSKIRSIVTLGRVEDGRGSLGSMASAPFPIPAHQTERADFRHSAFRLASPQGPRWSAA